MELNDLGGKELQFLKYLTINIKERMTFYFLKLFFFFLVSKKQNTVKATKLLEIPQYFHIFFGLTSKIK